MVYVYILNYTLNIELTLSVTWQVGCQHLTITFKGTVNIGEGGLGSTKKKKIEGSNSGDFTVRESVYTDSQLKK